MSILRFYWIDQDDHIRHPAEEIECVDDADALAKAAAMIAAQSEYPFIEIWDRVRHVAKVSAAGNRNLIGMRSRSDAARSVGAATYAK